MVDFQHSSDLLGGYLQNHGDFPRHRRGCAAQRGLQRLRGIPATLEPPETQKGGRHQEDAAENLPDFGIFPIDNRMES